MLGEGKTGQVTGIEGPQPTVRNARSSIEALVFIRDPRWLELSQVFVAPPRTGNTEITRVRFI